MINEEQREKIRQIITFLSPPPREASSGSSLSSIKEYKEQTVVWGRKDDDNPLFSMSISSSFSFLIFSSNVKMDQREFMPLNKFLIYLKVFVKDILVFAYLP